MFACRLVSKRLVAASSRGPITRHMVVASGDLVGSTNKTSTGDKDFADSVVFYGRTMKEYEIMFDVKIPSIDNKLKVLDCPGGPSSFQQQAREKFGLSVTSVDPMYATPDAELAAIGKRDIEATSARIRANPVDFPDIGENLAVVEKNRLRALDRFMTDFAANKGSSYVAAYLPTLPFGNKAFDITFSGHLLFCYSSIQDGGLMNTAMFDLKWHQAAVQELLRVTKKELIIYPIHAYHPINPNNKSTLGAEIHPYAKTIIDELVKSKTADCKYYAPNYFGKGIDLGVKITLK
jgi:hypothetical protein